MTEKQEPKKRETYVKPAMEKVELVAEEAVLATCKTGAQGDCGWDPVCLITARS